MCQGIRQTLTAVTLRFIVTSWCTVNERGGGGGAERAVEVFRAMDICAVEPGIRIFYHAFVHSCANDLCHPPFGETCFRDMS